MSKNRCVWVNLDNPDYVSYHDNEWGEPVHDDIKHFEILSLEGAQAGLNWELILNKRNDYRKAFKGFNPKKVSKMTDEELESLLIESNIVKNRLKVFSVRSNAQVFLQIQKEFGSFDAYVCDFKESDLLAKDLKKRGMKFVGSTTVYSYMQAAGLVNDHAKDCWKYVKA